MSKAPGEVAKALLDALPTLDFNKIVNEARKSYNIAIMGEPEAVATVYTVLRGRPDLPGDVKVALWQYEQGKSAPADTGKTEFAIVAPATEETVRRARDVFSGVQLILVTVGDAPAPEGSVKPVRLPALDAHQIRRVLVPHLVDRLWDRRLSLGRAVPATRDHIALRLTTDAVRNPKVLLGSVAGAGYDRNGAPTPATAVALLHQAALIASLAAVYGLDLEDRAGIYTRVAPSLAPTVLIDGAEAAVSKFARDASKGSRFEKIAAPAAAYVLRPTLTASSTMLAGLTARRIFRGASQMDEPRPSATARTRAAGKRILVGASHAVAVAGSSVATRVRRDKQGQPAETSPESHVDDGDVTGDQTSTTPANKSGHRCTGRVPRPCRQALRTC
jgi:hypothetical protein